MFLLDVIIFVIYLIVNGVKSLLYLFLMSFLIMVSVAGGIYALWRRRSIKNYREIIKEAHCCAKDIAGF